MRIAIKRVGEQLSLKETKKRYRMDAAAAILGKEAVQQAVWLDAERTLAFVCDELAGIRHKGANFFLGVPNPFSPVQSIIGDVVFFRTRPHDPIVEEIWDYELEDIQETDIQLIEHLLSDGKQVSLAIEYFARGG